MLQASKEKSTESLSENGDKNTVSDQNDDFLVSICEPILTEPKIAAEAEEHLRPISIFDTFINPGDFVAVQEECHLRRRSPSECDDNSTKEPLSEVIDTEGDANMDAEPLNIDENPEEDHLEPPSLMSYIYMELTRGYKLDNEDGKKLSEKSKKVYTFIKIPLELEKFICFGFLQCVDAFLYTFTFLPLRFILAFSEIFRKCFARS